MSSSAIVLGSIGGFILIIAGFLLFLVRARRRVYPNTILEADLNRAYEEDVPEGRLSKLLRREAPVVREVVEALRLASEDRNVAMLVARVGRSRMKMGKVQEIRDAVNRFRNKGKRAVAYAESFGEFGPGNTAYYLATAFDRIYLQPSGKVGLTGLGIRTPFLRELLDRVGIEPQMGFRKQYKSAAYTFTEKEYTSAHREADQALLESLLSQMVEGISESRQLDRERVMSLFEAAPLSGRRALQEKLLDGLAYRDEVRSFAEREAGRGARFLDLYEYMRKKRGRSRGKQKIALIYGSGRIVLGKSRYVPFGRSVMGSESVSKAFRSAVRDKHVKAIVFRIDSPGGSYVASDAIWRETVCAREAGKPVIASMSDVAGSGGYFVAMACHRIIAHPGTITGSIGVVAGKMVTSTLWKRLGIHWGTLVTNRNADFWDSTKGYSEGQWKLMGSWLDEIYEDFLTKAADGRRMDVESVKRSAQGRIWSGRDAKERGLVDELGGIHEAILAAKAAAGIPEEESVVLKIFPLRRALWKRWSAAREDGSAQDLLTDLQRCFEAEWSLHGEELLARSPLMD